MVWGLSLETGFYLLVSFLVGSEVCNLMQRGGYHRTCQRHTKACTRTLNFKVGIKELNEETKQPIYAYTKSNRDEYIGCCFSSTTLQSCFVRQVKEGGTSKLEKHALKSEESIFPKH